MWGHTCIVKTKKQRRGRSLKLKCVHLSLQMPEEFNLMRTSSVHSMLYAELFLSFTVCAATRKKQQNKTICMWSIGHLTRWTDCVSLQIHHIVTGVFSGYFRYVKVHALRGEIPEFKTHCFPLCAISSVALCLRSLRCCCQSDVFQMV